MTRKETTGNETAEELVRRSRRQLAAGLLLEITGSRDRADREALGETHRHETGTDEPDPEEQKELLKLYRGAHHVDVHVDPDPTEGDTQ